MPRLCELSDKVDCSADDIATTEVIPDHCKPLLQEVDAVTLRLQLLQDEPKLQKGEVRLLL